MSRRAQPPQRQPECDRDRASSPRQEWATPRLVRMRAGDAEVGANPLRPEGPIAMGS